MLLYILAMAGSGLKCCMRVVALEGWVVSMAFGAFMTKSACSLVACGFWSIVKFAGRSG